MNESEKLQIYLKRIEAMAKDKIQTNDYSAIKALKEAINFIEGEMIGY